MYISPINYCYDYETPTIEEIVTNQAQETLKDIGHKIDDEISNRCIQIAYKWGIDINEEELVQALKGDRERYEEAYHRGWKDCEKHYEEIVEDLK